MHRAAVFTDLESLKLQAPAIILNPKFSPTPWDLTEHPHPQCSMLESHLGLRSWFLRAGLGCAASSNLYSKSVLLPWPQSWMWLPSERSRGQRALSCSKWGHEGRKPGSSSREGLNQYPQLLPWSAGQLRLLWRARARPALSQWRGPEGPVHCHPFPIMALFL